MERVARMLGFNNFEIVEARGIAGGLILMWTDDVQLEMEWKSDRIICCNILVYDRVKRWSLFTCHGTLYNCEKRVFWEDFEEVITTIRNPWLIIGDLNEVVSQEEKWGGRSVWRKQLYLKEFINMVGGVDLGFIGNKYTWENKQEGRMFIKERLDRAVASKEWTEDFH